MNFNDSKLKEISGKVISIKDSNLIIENDNKQYLITDFKENYNIGDEVKFSYYEKNTNNDNELPEIIIENEKLLNKYINEEETTDNRENNVDSIDKIDSTNNIDIIDTKHSDVENNSDADVEVLGFFEDLKRDIDEKKLGEEIKEKFVVMVDFLFYEGEIGGYTFSELSNETKLKVISIGLYIDEKIEIYFPGYKEKISNTTSKAYNSVKNKLIEIYLDTTTSICESNEDLCITAKSDFQNLKKSFGLTWELIKDIAKDGWQRLVSWYEVWREE